MARREWKWTEFQFDKLNKIKAILEELKEYKPLTLRQIYYQLVGKGYIENNKSQYGMLSKIIKWARIDSLISWDDIEDRVRVFYDLRGWERSEDFLNQSIKHFLKGYQRDLLQTQEKYVEIWIEKDALSSIFTRASKEFTVPVVVCRGFTSVSFLNQYKERLNYIGNKKPVLLYFGDFDPSGLEMLNSMEETIKNELNVNDIEYKRIALMKEDIEKYNLPNDPDALKKSDTRSKKFKEQYGDYAVELDALRPDVLESKIRKAIQEEIDIDLFNNEYQENVEEIKRLSLIQENVKDYVAKLNI